MRYRDSRITLHKNMFGVAGIPEDFDPDVLATPREVAGNPFKGLRTVPNRTETRKGSSKPRMRRRGVSVADKPWAAPKQPQHYEVAADGKIIRDGKVVKR